MKTIIAAVLALAACAADSKLPDPHEIVRDTTAAGAPLDEEIACRGEWPKASYPRPGCVGASTPNTNQSIPCSTVFEYEPGVVGCCWRPDTASPVYFLECP